MFFDPLYFLFLAPALLLGVVAQWLVKSAYARTSEIAVSSGMSGAEAAARMLHAARVPGARIEMIDGVMSDHYDPRDRTLRLSRDVYGGRSIAAVGIACHEAGHAIQHARAYAPLVLRNMAVPAASFGSGIGVFLIMIGAMLGAMGLAMFGLVLYAGVVVFQLVNLPVEFDASARAKRALADIGIIGSPGEAAEVNRVLNAAALTYVAATVTAILQLLYFAFRLGLFGQRQQ
jgi:Zn-dependent membrane protease YugP